MIITKDSPFTKEEIEKRKNNREILGALSMDLSRVSMALYKKSDRTAEVFTQEALKRKREIDASLIKPYIIKLLDEMEKSFQSKDRMKKAEDALMYATLLQNAALAS